MIYWEYEKFKEEAVAMARRIKVSFFNPTAIVCVVRGGFVPSAIMAKVLGVPCGCWYPKTDTLAIEEGHSNILVVEDLIAKGRTYERALTSSSLNKFTWKYAPCLIDKKFLDETDLDMSYIIDCMKISDEWYVFPWEDINMAKEGDRGLFRDKTDSYGKLSEVLNV
jgi:hypoxanthine phosphoribosyltransferase